MKIRYVLAFSFLLSASLPAQDGAAGADWRFHGGTQLAWRYSALNQINATNVKNLTPAWIFQTGDYENGLQSTPIVVDGVMYLTSSRDQVFALDASTGKLLWRHDYTPSPGGRNRGVAVGAGKVYVGTSDDFVIALDQRTGKEVWKTAMDDVSQCGCHIYPAPLFLKDKVVVGNAGGDSAFRGYLTALDANTGRVAWRFYTIPGPGEKGHETWKGDSWKFGGGATWITGSYDPSLNLVYWGVGNAAGDAYSGNRYAGERPEGVNLYSSSIVALDGDSGKLRWYYQEVPKDVWDYDAVYESVLIDREVRGQVRKLLLHVNKNGYMFVLDRTDGQYFGAYPIIQNHNFASGITSEGKWLDRLEPVEDKSTFICPSAIGGKSWNETAYSPRTGYIYTPGLEMCGNYTARRQDPREGQNFSAGNWDHVPPRDGPARGHLDAWDPVTGKRIWTYSYKYFLLASLLATAGDLIFTGDPEGEFFALDARSGTKLWSFQTGAGHRGSPISYSVGGRQYIATPTGMGSVIGRIVLEVFPDLVIRNGSALVVFALPAQSTRKNTR